MKKRAATIEKLFNALEKALTELNDLPHTHATWDIIEDLEKAFEKAKAGLK